MTTLGQSGWYPGRGASLGPGRPASSEGSVKDGESRDRVQMLQPGSIAAITLRKHRLGSDAAGFHGGAAGGGPRWARAWGRGPGPGPAVKARVGKFDLRLTGAPWRGRFRPSANTGFRAFLAEGAGRARAKGAPLEGRNPPAGRLCFPGPAPGAEGLGGDWGFGGRWADGNGERASPSMADEAPVPCDTAGSVAPVEVSIMNARDCQPANPEKGSCPFFQPSKADWLYPVEGCCRGLPQGLLMIPSIDEYRTLCSTTGYTECLIYRYRQGEKGLEEWVLAHYQPAGRFSPLQGLRGSRSEAPA